MSVTRYNCETVFAGNGNCVGDMESHPEGSYVEWDDYKALLDENERLKEQYDQLNQWAEMAKQQLLENARELLK